jgi:hypothetical protein
LVLQCKFESALSKAFEPYVKENSSRNTSMIRSGDVSRNGRYKNTSLPLIPDIRSESIQQKGQDLFLSLFNIRTRKSAIGGNSVILRGGPNGRRNRYLKYQYDRML